MKTFDWSLFLGCCVIAVGILFTGVMVKTAIDEKLIPGAYPVPDSFTVYPKNADSDFLSPGYAADYLGISFETLELWIENGTLKGTYMTHGNNSEPREYVFSKSKLREFMDSRIG